MCVWSKWGFVAASLIASSGSALLLVFNLTVVVVEATLLNDCASNLLTLPTFCWRSDLILGHCSTAGEHVKLLA